MEIKLTQGKVAYLDDVDADLASFKWYAAKNGKTFYAVRTSRQPDGKTKTVCLHRVVAARMGFTQLVSHRPPWNGLDCRRANLRPGTKSLNSADQPLRADNTSGFKGVSWDKGHGRWRAELGINGKRVFLGYFVDPNEAAKAYDHAAVEAFGEFAVLNFPPIGP